MRTEAAFTEAVEAAGLSLRPVAPADADGWVTVSRLVDQHDSTLTDWIDLIMDKRSVQDRTVATMLGWKAGSYLASLLPLVTWARFDVVPDAHVHNLAVQIPGDPAVSFAMREYRLRESRGSVDDVVDVWWDGLIAPLLERWRQEARLGRRALEAFAVSHAVTIIGGVIDDLDDAHARIDTFVSALPTRLRPMAKVMEYQAADAPWKALGERTSCCLAYKVPEGGYCVTCNLLDDDERTALADKHGASWRRPVPAEIR
ncbi:MAG: (2Fe-2S)-binding protein [Actinomycetota bacterium]